MRRPQERHCSSCSKDKPLLQLGWCHSPKNSRRFLAEEDCGSHPDQEIHPKHEPRQRPSPSHSLELNPKPTPYTSHLAPPPHLCYSYFSICLANSMSILHDYYFHVLYFIAYSACLLLMFVFIGKQYMHFMSLNLANHSPTLNHKPHWSPMYPLLILQHYWSPRYLLPSMQHYWPHTVRVCYITHLTLQYLQLCTQLTKAYVAETSCNQLFD